jgi:putative hydrolase of the HAD superfamily
MTFTGLRAVLFDAGNTLLHLDYEFIGKLLDEHGQPHRPFDIRVAEYTARATIDRQLAARADGNAQPGHGVEDLLWPDAGDARPSYFATILHRLGLPWAAARPILDALQAHNANRCLWRVVEADTAAVLAELRARGFTLAVISNADGRVEGDLERAGLRRYFATVVDSHVVGVEKPDPAIFRLALDRLGASPDDAIYVGDVFSIDVQGARGAGLGAVLVDSLGRYPGAIDCPRISRLGELLDLLPQRAPAP